MACGAGLLLGLSQGKLLSQAWDGSSNNRWNTSSNWTPASVPDAVDATATLGSIVTSNTSIGLRGTRVVGTLNIQGSQNFTIFNGSGGTRDLEMNVSSGTAAINISGSNTSQLASTVRLVLFDNTVISNTGTGSFTINGVVSESGGAKSLTHNGTGLTILNGANTFSGGLTINSGTVRFGNNAAAGTGTLSLNGGKIESSGASRTLTNAVTVGGDFEVGGTLDLTLGGAMDLGASTRTITTSNTALTTFSGIVSGTGGITKAGSGTLVLSGANNYSGATTINAGVLNVQNATALGTTAGSTTVNSGGALALGGGITITGEALSIAGNGGGAGALRNASGNNTFSGDITLAADAEIENAVAGTLLTIGNTSYTNWINTTGSGYTVSFDGAGDIWLNSGITGSGTLSSTGPGNVVKNGSGTLTFYADQNWYTGSTTVNDGTLSLDTLTGLNGAIKGTVVNIGDGTGAAGSAVLRNGSATSPVANEMINDSATLTFRSDGLYNLNTQTETIGALDFTGGEVRTGTGGSLRINASSAAASITTHASSATALIDATGGDVQLNGSRTFTVNNGTAATDLEVRGTVADGSAASGVTKSGSGRMALTGTTANTYTGTTTVNGGTLELAKSSGVTAISGSAVTVNSGGTLLLGSSNQINDSAALTLAGGTFSTGDTVGFSETLGTLTLSGTSSIDLGTASHLLQFADSSALSGSWTGSLTIYGWTGLPYASGTSGQIFFGSSNSTLTSSQLAMISFSGFGTGAVLLTNGELVPVAVPETESVVAACLLALGVGWRERRRLGMLFCRLRNC